MTRKNFKLLTIPLLFLLFFSMTSMFCCCIGEDSTHSHSHGEVNHESMHHRDHEHHHGKASSDSCECGHEFLGDVNNQAINITDFGASTSHFLYKSLIVGRIIGLVSYKNSFHFNDAGPPGNFSSLPIYLEISNLRI